MTLIYLIFCRIAKWPKWLFFSFEKKMSNMEIHNLSFSSFHVTKKYDDVRGNTTYLSWCFSWLCTKCWGFFSWILRFHIISFFSTISSSLILDITAIFMFSWDTKKGGSKKWLWIFRKKITYQLLNISLKKK